MVVEFVVGRLDVGINSCSSSSLSCSRDLNDVSNNNCCGSDNDGGDGGCLEEILTTSSVAANADDNGDTVGAAKTWAGSNNADVAGKY